jgi:hypothetical protein
VVFLYRPIPKSIFLMSNGVDLILCICCIIFLSYVKDFMSLLAQFNIMLFLCEYRMPNHIELDYYVCFDLCAISYPYHIASALYLVVFKSLSFYYDIFASLAYVFIHILLNNLTCHVLLFLFLIMTC